MITGHEAEKSAGIQHEFAGVVNKLFHSLGASIAFRGPSGEAAQRFERGYAPKSGAHYTKSTDWGPMRGYLLKDYRLTRFDKESGESLGHSDGDELATIEQLTLPLETSLMSILEKMNHNIRQEYQFISFDGKELIFKCIENPKGYSPYFKVDISEIRKAKCIQSRPYDIDHLTRFEDAIEAFDAHEGSDSHHMWESLEEVFSEKRKKLNKYIYLLDGSIKHDSSINVSLSSYSVAEQKKTLKRALRYIKERLKVEPVFANESENVEREINKALAKIDETPVDFQSVVDAVKAPLTQIWNDANDFFEMISEYDVPVRYSDSVDGVYNPVEVIADYVEVRRIIDDEGIELKQEYGASELYDTVLLPITGDWDILWISTPDYIREALGNELLPVNTFKDWKGFDLAEEGDEHRKSLYLSTAKIYTEIRGSLQSSFPKCPFPETFADLIHNNLEPVSRAGCITPFEFLCGQVMNYIYLMDPEHKEKMSPAMLKDINNMLILSNPIQHGAENRNPGKPSALDGVIIHFYDGKVIATESEEELVALLLVGNYLENYPIEIHPGWDLDLWGHVLHKKTVLDIPLTEKESQAYGRWLASPNVLPDGLIGLLKECQNNDALHVAAETMGRTPEHWLSRQTSEDSLGDDSLGSSNDSFDSSPREAERFKSLSRRSSTLSRRGSTK